MRFAKTLWQDYIGCSLAFLTVVSVEVFRHQAIMGELVKDQGIECCALTYLTYLTWLVCWTSVEVEHHRAVRSPLQPLLLMCTCAHLLAWFAGVCCKVKTPSTGSARKVSVLFTHNNNNSNNNSNNYNYTLIFLQVPNSPGRLHAPQPNHFERIATNQKRLSGVDDKKTIEGRQCKSEWLD